MRSADTISFGQSELSGKITERKSGSSVGEMSILLPLGSVVISTCDAR
jgi:hypothetical protein